jgi:hypothetical protein
MPASITEFKSSFSTDVARPNKFEVEIPIPIGMIPYLGTQRRLRLRCETADLPGRSLATTGLKVYNIEEKFPYMTTYPDITMTFIVSDDMKEKKFFDAWINWINPSVHYNMKYKNDYAVNVRINQYSVTNKATYSVDLQDAFPVGINDLNLDWSSDGYHKLSVTFAYTQWRNNSLEALGMELLENNIADIMTNGSLGRDKLAPIEDRNELSVSAFIEENRVTPI